MTIPRQPLKIVTTSWDDGHPLDLKMADLLSGYGLGGTFYVPASNREGLPVLDKAGIRGLAGRFEVGGHTSGHADLTLLSPEDAKREILSGKEYLEEAISGPVRIFCFPKGRLTKSLVAAVKEAGFIGARTTRCFITEPEAGSFLMPVTVQAYPHTRISYLKQILRDANFGGFVNYVFGARLERGVAELCRRMFDCVAQRGGVFHLWGHSWEIEERGMWKEMESIFEYISGKEGVGYLSNSVALKAVRGDR